MDRDEQNLLKNKARAQRQAMGKGESRRATTELRALEQKLGVKSGNKTPTNRSLKDKDEQKRMMEKWKQTDSSRCGRICSIRDVIAILGHNDELVRDLVIKFPSLQSSSNAVKSFVRLGCPSVIVSFNQFGNSF